MFVSFSMLVLLSSNPFVPGFQFNFQPFYALFRNFILYLYSFLNYMLVVNGGRKCAITIPSAIDRAQNAKYEQWSNRTSIEQVSVMVAVVTTEHRVP